MSEEEGEPLSALFPRPRTPRCPKCHRTDAVKPIIYGRLAEPLKPGEVGGGCCMDDDSPAWHCLRCRQSFGLISDDELPELIQ